MHPIRPDLNGIRPDVVAYIQQLEKALEKARPSEGTTTTQTTPDVNKQPAEQPTTLNIITACKSGLAKRSPRHLYPRQRRGGMGLFDLDGSPDDPPAILALADEQQTLLVISNRGRVFRLRVDQLPQTPIRSRGTQLTATLSLEPEEKLAYLLPTRAEGHLAILSQSGRIRLLRHHVFGSYMKPGTKLYDYGVFGPTAAACWLSTTEDIFIATQSGKAIRFPAHLVPPQGCAGIRVAGSDKAVAITSVNDTSGVFLLGFDGKGTIRSMQNFLANKSPGGGGKQALNTSKLITAASVENTDEIFIISRLGKIIRFWADEIPKKSGVVQGVNCMSFRADDAMAAIVSPPSLTSV